MGYYTSNGWQSGSLWQKLHKLTLSDAITAECDQSKLEPIADTQVWLILDGTLHTSWCDPISSLFDSSRKLILPNAETFILNGNSNFFFFCQYKIFRKCSLNKQSSPPLLLAITSQPVLCSILGAIVYFKRKVIQYKI